MNPVELFTSPDGLDIVIRQDCKYHTLTDQDTELIQFLYNQIQDLYPDAFKSLQELYAKAFNFKFLIIRRFAKCNFSVLDDKNDIQADQSFRLEHVGCPLRGECKHEGIICKPKFNTTLSNREIEIVKLICRHFTDQQISEMLFLSYHTVCNHRRNILRKINGHDKTAIVEFAHKNNLL